MYAIIDAPGHHGRQIFVWQSHSDLEKARRAVNAGRNEVAILEGCDARAGTRLHPDTVNEKIASGEWKLLSD